LLKEIIDTWNATTTKKHKNDGRANTRDTCCTYKYNGRVLDSTEEGYTHKSGIEMVKPALQYNVDVQQIAAHGKIGQPR